MKKKYINFSSIMYKLKELVIQMKDVGHENKKRLYEDHVGLTKVEWEERWDKLIENSEKLYAEIEKQMIEISLAQEALTYLRPMIKLKGVNEGFKSQFIPKMYDEKGEHLEREDFLTPNKYDYVHVKANCLIPWYSPVNQAISNWFNGDNTHTYYTVDIEKEMNFINYRRKYDKTREIFDYLSEPK